MIPKPFPDGDLGYLQPPLYLDRPGYLHYLYQNEKGQSLFCVYRFPCVVLPPLQDTLPPDGKRQCLKPSSSLFPCLSLQTLSDGDLVEGGAGWPVCLLPYRLYQRWLAYLTYKHDTFLLLSVLVTEQLTGLQLQSMGTGSSWLTVFSGLGVIGLASLCAIFIPSAHPSSKVQYVGLRSSLIFCVSCRVAPQPIT